MRRESSWEVSFDAACLRFFSTVHSRPKYTWVLVCCCIGAWWCVFPDAYPNYALQVNAPWSKVAEEKTSLHSPSCCDPFWTGTPPCIEFHLISMDDLMQKEKNPYSFVWTPQSVSPSFPILLVDVYIHILEKIPNRWEWSFTSNTLCLPAIIFSSCTMPLDLPLALFFAIFLFWIQSERQNKKKPKPKWTKNVIQSLCRWCYWQFQLRNHLYRHDLIWHTEELGLFEKALCSQCSGYRNSTSQLKLTGWVRDQLHPCSSSKFLSFVLLQLSGCSCKKNIKAVERIPCQLLTTKPGHFLIHKP